MKLGKSHETRLRVAADEISTEIGDRSGLRILHVTDVHNRTAAFKAWRILNRGLLPDLTVCTGDLCGIGGPIEQWLMSRWLREFEGPNVLAPGNHDSTATSDSFERAGGVVLSAHRVTRVGDCQVWGYGDPNRTKLIIGPRYDPSLCRRAASWVSGELERINGPFLIAVHNELMVPDVSEQCPLVLSGHFHSARVRRQGATLFVRCGTSGGRSKYSNSMRFAIIDIERTRFIPERVWLVEIAKDRKRVIPAEG